MDVKLKCACGQVQGVASNITPTSGNRVVCYCDDCQAFARHLKRESDILDEFGGTELFQIAPSQIKIESGAEHIRCTRLTSKGLYRWHTGCCNTAIGNTMKASMPFVGVFPSFMHFEQDREKVLGPVRAYMQTQYALSPPTYPFSSEKFPLGITLRIIRKIVLWKLKGMDKPSVFFTKSGEPVVKPTVLSE